MTLAQLAPTTVPTPEVDAWVLVPFLVLAVGGVLMLTVSSLAKGLPARTYPIATAVLGGAAAVTTVPLWQRVQDAERGPASTLADAVGFDGFSLFLTFLICASVALVALLAADYLRREDLEGPELYVLMLLAGSGGVVMTFANDLIVLFLGLEALSIAAYVLAAMHARRYQSQEAGMKYFVLGAFSSAFFLYGIALVYGATGSTNLVDISEFLATTTLTDDGLLLAGFAMLLVGFAFKVAAVPFHSWTPDVYEGSPSPVVAFMASAVKIAAFGGLLRVFVVTFGDYAEDWQPAVYGLAVLTLLVGAVLALSQRNVKRMLAYSSINHAGFILVGVEAASDDGTRASLFYLATYSFLVIGSFGVVTLVGRRGDARHDLDDYNGLGSARPWLAFAFTVFLLGLAGVPLTSGYVAKFEIVNAAIDARSYWLAIVAMVSAVIATFVYLRIIVAMYLSEADESDAESATGLASIRVPVLAVVALVVAFGVTMVFGLAPDPLDELARDAVPVLVRG